MVNLFDTKSDNYYRTIFRNYRHHSCAYNTFKKYGDGNVATLMLLTDNFEGATLAYVLYKIYLYIDPDYYYKKQKVYLYEFNGYEKNDYPFEYFYKKEPKRAINLLKQVAHDFNSKLL